MTVNEALALLDAALATASNTADVVQENDVLPGIQADENVGALVEENHDGNV